MNRSRCSRIVATIILCVPGITSCVDRTETLRIKPDGTVLMDLRFTADNEGELIPGRIPVKEDGWSIEQTIKTKDNGEIEKHELVATKRFKPNHVLPDQYIAPDDPLADVYLRFPTELTIEHRDDATYYHLRRVYPARPWQYLAIIKEQLEDKYDLKGLQDRDPGTMTDGELERLVRGMATFELEKNLAFARKAFLDVTPEGTQDGWLLYRDRVLALLDELDYQRLAVLIRRKEKMNESDVADIELELNATQFELQMTQSGEAALRDNCDYTDEDIEKFRKYFAWYEKYQNVTDDLAMEKFKIVIIMPGEVIAANTESIDGNIVTWSFDGKTLYDRTLDLMVSSHIRH